MSLGRSWNFPSRIAKKRRRHRSKTKTNRKLRPTLSVRLKRVFVSLFSLKWIFTIFFMNFSRQYRGGNKLNIAAFLWFFSDFFKHFFEIKQDNLNNIFTIFEITQRINEITKSIRNFATYQPNSLWILIFSEFADLLPWNFFMNLIVTSRSLRQKHTFAQAQNS